MLGLGKKKSFERAEMLAANVALNAAALIMGHTLQWECVSVTLLDQRQSASDGRRKYKAIVHGRVSWLKAVEHTVHAELHAWADTSEYGAVMHPLRLLIDKEGAHEVNVTPYDLHHLVWEDVDKFRVKSWMSLHSDPWTHQDGSKVVHTEDRDF